MNSNLVFAIGLLIAVFAFIKPSTSQTCPNAQAVADFNITRFSGRWYFVKRYFALNTKIPLGDKINKKIAVLDGNCSIFDLTYKNRTVFVDFQTIVNEKVIKEGTKDSDTDGNISWKQTIAGGELFQFFLSKFET